MTLTGREGGAGQDARRVGRQPLVLTGLFRELERPEGPPERPLVVSLGSIGAMTRSHVCRVPGTRAPDPHDLCRDSLVSCNRS